MFLDSIQFPGLVTSTSDGAEVRQLLTLVRPDFVSAFDPGSGKPSSESGDKLEMPDFASDFDPGPGKPFSESGDILEMPDFVSVIDPGPGKPRRSPETY